MKMCNFYYVNMYNETAAYRNTENEFVIEQNEDSEKHKYENLLWQETNSSLMF